LRLEPNRGKGAAVFAGMPGRAWPPGFTHAIQIDATTTRPRPNSAFHRGFSEGASRRACKGCRNIMKACGGAPARTAYHNSIGLAAYAVAPDSRCDVRVSPYPIAARWQLDQRASVRAPHGI